MQGSERRLQACLRSVLLIGLVMTGSSHFAVAQSRRPGPNVVRNPGPPAVQVKIAFGSRAQAERLANDLAVQANNICIQMNRQFKGNRNYPETYRQMYGVLEDAKQIRDFVARGVHRNPRHDEDAIATALHHMDRQFHDIEEELHTWRAEAGPQSPRDVVQLSQLVDEFEGTLHNMMEDYGVRSRLAAGPAHGAVAPLPPSRVRR